MGPMPLTAAWSAPASCIGPSRKERAQDDRFTLTDALLADSFDDDGLKFQAVRAAKEKFVTL
jgi:hypothetical protein